VGVSRRVELRNGAPKRTPAGLQKTRPLQFDARYLGADMMVLLENDIVGGLQVCVCVCVRVCVWEIGIKRVGGVTGVWNVLTCLASSENHHLSRSSYTLHEKSYKYIHKKIF
jgi:hypothetical protein